MANFVASLNLHSRTMDGRIESDLPVERVWTSRRALGYSAAFFNWMIP